MNYEYALGQCTNYLLDILDVPSGSLPDRAQGHWDEVFKLAADQRIYHYLAAWMLEYWNDSLSAELKHQLWMDLEWNKARNIKLTQEIIELAKMFREEGIPAMFLKGAAGLVSGLYPPGLRYISDIDVMIKENNKEHTISILQSHGYYNVFYKNIKHHHHLAPLYNQITIGVIEIHLKPYHHCFKNSIIKDIWDGSIEVTFQLESITVPSITDHVWILLRKELVSGVLSPRLNELIEINFIINLGNFINDEVLIRRAELERIPNIISKMSYCLRRFVGISIFNSYSTGRFKFFEAESIRFHKLKIKHGLYFTYLALLLASVRYFSGSSVINKMQTFFAVISSFTINDLFMLALPSIGQNSPLYKYKTFLNCQFKRMF